MLTIDGDIIETEDGINMAGQHTAFLLLSDGPAKLDHTHQLLNRARVKNVQT
jgi:hypothetical protein